MRTTSQSLFDLAPNGVYKHFEFLQNLVVSYTTISPLPEGGLFSVALSIIRRSESLPVREHPVLRCPDFPLQGCLNKPRATIRPTQFLNPPNLQIFPGYIENVHKHHTCALLFLHGLL